jgi:formiminoglutamase/agmatinase
MPLRKPVGLKPPPYSDPLDTRILSIIRRRKQPREKAVNILGIPFDGAALGRKGAREGPVAIREALRFNSNFNPELGISLLGRKMVDLGDLAVETGDVREVHRKIERESSSLFRLSSLLLAIGGDNSISLPLIKSYAKKFGRVGLIVIDSHYDLRGEIHGKPTSGSSYWLAIKALRTSLDSANVVEIGLHGFLNSIEYASRARDYGITVITAEKARNLGPGRAAKQALEIASKGKAAVYVSIDIDSVEMSSASGVSAPSAGGLTPTELFDLAFYLGSRSQVHAADIVETSPPLDPTGKTPLVAATALLYFAAGFFARFENSTWLSQPPLNK